MIEMITTDNTLRLYARVIEEDWPLAYLQDPTEDEIRRALLTIRPPYPYPHE